MATYYVRTDGNDSNTGLGPATNQAWQTITKALGATGIGSGDTLYIAPGDYRQTVQITVGGTYTAPTFVYGNPTASQFSGIAAGRVLITNRQISDVGPVNVNQYLFVLISKNYLNFENLVIETATNRGLFLITNCVELKWRKCLIMNSGFDSAIQVTDNTATGLTKNYLFQQCHFVSMSNGAIYGDFTTGKNSPATQDYVYGLTVDRCVCISGTNASFVLQGSNATYQGTTFTFLNNTGFSISLTSTAGRSLTTIKNNVTNPAGNIACAQGDATCTVTNNVASGYNVATAVVQSNNFTNPYVPFNTGIWRLWGMTQYDWFSANGLYTYATGSSTGTPATDFYGDAWAGGTPNIGSYNNTTATIAGQYNPTERNASVVTIAPGSTSQSIEVYLGATGLTASTSGLSARYNRTRTASVDIPLVARVIGSTDPSGTGVWIAGGFAEVDSVNMPGVYRLDLPDAALIAGADDVTVVVRGASGTNGAVMTIKLSSGGLTGAQTATAVWGASVAGYTSASEFGGVINETRNVVDATPTLVWDEFKVDHTTPGTFGDYLDTKVSTGADTSRIQLRQGPFLIRQNASEGLITEVNQFLSTVPNIEIVLIDSSGGSVSVSGSTLVMRVRNQAGTAVVNNITPTVAYADGGVIRWTPNLSWTALGVTTAGTYRIVVERTMGTVTTTFGPFLVQLSSG
jgi:hypothetical protein